MFTVDHIKAILEPFNGKRMRMRKTELTNGLYIESRIDGDFHWEINNHGLEFFIDGFDYKLHDELRKNICDGVKKSGIYTYTLDKLLDDSMREYGKNVVIHNIMEHLKDTMKVQIGLIHRHNIKSIAVHEKHFVINGIEFFIS